MTNLRRFALALPAAAVCGLMAALVLDCLQQRATAADITPAERMKLLKTFASEFVDITPGKGKFPKSFRMGSKEGADSERPIHKVTFKHSFSIAKYEVPQNLYEAVMGTNPSKWKGPRNSVEMMTFDEANEFCDEITEMLHDAKLIKPGETIRLPSEAEWEYCCRAGTTTAYSFGDKAQAAGDEGKKASLLDAYGWHTGNASGNDPPVGALKPNPWGLCDMHGYLAEYVLDDWADDYTNAPSDGSARKATDEKNYRGIRGGSWKDRHEQLRSAARMRTPTKNKGDEIGFRCVKVTRK